MIKSWKQLEEKFTALLNENITSAGQLEDWLIRRSKLLMEIEEDLGWRYIRMTGDTTNEQYRKDYEFFIENIQPNVIRFEHKLNLKLVNSPYLNQLEQKYFTAIRLIKRQVQLYREENIPLMVEEEKTSQEFARITGSMTIRCQGKEYTLQQASRFLYDPKRSMRKKIYNKIANRRLKDYTKLNEILDKLLNLRTQIAQNAGYDNFRDYKHDELGRFDYSVDDVLKLDKSISLTAVPLYHSALNYRKNKLKLDQLKPWDLDVDVDNKPALQPFKSTEEFVQKAIKTLNAVRPSYGQYLQTMYEKGFLDLESRKGKAPGGYNYPLLVSNIPFIFMNAAGTITDVITLLHEAGHAIHAFLTADIKIIEQKEPPSEIAELASMSMELISMEHWDNFFENPDDLRRAKRYQIERVIEVLPWIALIDSFQHWLYTEYPHITAERYAAWLEQATTYFPKIIDWTGLEWYFANLWQKQLHIYEVPFYYIEYAIAQLGAIAIWRNYKLNPQQALDNYEKALKLGYTRPIPEIYAAAGIEFNFSADYINELLNFVYQEYEKLL